MARDPYDLTNDANPSVPVEATQPTGESTPLAHERPTGQSDFTLDPLGNPKDVPVAEEVATDEPAAAAPEPKKTKKK